MAGTPMRSFRVEDGVWEAAKAEAKRRNETLAAAILRFLRGYGQAGGRELASPSVGPAPAPDVATRVRRAPRSVAGGRCARHPRSVVGRDGQCQTCRLEGSG